MRLKINESLILWPGGSRKKPEGIMIPTHLKVLTIKETPFVYVRSLSPDEIDCLDDEVLCPHFNETNGLGKRIRKQRLLPFFILLSLTVSA